MYEPHWTSGTPLYVPSGLGLATAKVYPCEDYGHLFDELNYMDGDPISLFILHRNYTHLIENHTIPEWWTEGLKEGEEGYPFLVVPIYAYEHSGIVLSCTPFSCRWDSGTWGFAYIKHEALEKYPPGTPGLTPEFFREQIESHVKYLSDLLSGNVWGYRVFDKYTEEELDSCWCIVGDKGEAEAMATESFHWHEKQLLLEGVQDIDCHSWYLSLV